jgi:hypothetical protein
LRPHGFSYFVWYFFARLGEKYQTKKIKYHVAVRRELVEGQATVAFA